MNQWKQCYFALLSKVYRKPQKISAEIQIISFLFPWKTRYEFPGFCGTRRNRKS